MRKLKRKKNINFLLENKHYKTLHIFLYLVSVAIITIIYFITLLIFSAYVHTLVTVIASLLIGLYIVFNRDRIVMAVSDQMQERRRKRYKETSKENLKTTLRKITPKNKRLKLNIKGRTSFKEKIYNVKERFSKKDKKKKSKVDYIEID